MKKAIIIGATYGIGHAIAKVLAQNDYTLGLLSKNEDMLIELQHFLKTTSFIEKIDTKYVNYTLKKLNSMLLKLGHVDLIIINIGIGYLHPNINWVKESEILNKNVIALTALLNTSYHFFLNQGYGSLATVSSATALIPNPNNPAYNASKAFIHNYLNSIRLHALQTKKPIYITDIRPGFKCSALNTEYKKELFWVKNIDKSAESLYKALQAKKNYFYITKSWKIFFYLLKLIPESFYKYFF